MESPKVYAIILNYKTPDDTRECALNVSKSNYPNFEILIVDNDAPSKDFKDFEFTVISTGQNLGYGHGNNVGIQYAYKRGAEFFWILNPDVGVLPNTLSTLISLMMQNRSLGICGPVLKTPNESIFHNELKPGFHIRKHYNFIPKPEDESIETQYVEGACFLIRKKLIEEVGLFRTDFFLYGEELELCMRAKERGWKTSVSLQSFARTRSESEPRPNRSYYLKRNTLFLSRIKKRERFKTIRAILLKKNRFESWRAILKGFLMPIKEVSFLQETHESKPH